MTQEIELEGIIRDVDIFELGRYNCRLAVLIESSDGQLYPTYLENRGEGFDARQKHLNKLGSLLENYVVRVDSRDRNSPRVHVCVVKDEEKKDDMPLYRVIKQYLIIK